MSSELKIDQAATSQERSYMDLLPAEILCMVFDHLDLDDVKNASLVCKRWNNIMFSSGYIARFIFNIDTLKNVLHNENQIKLNKVAIGIASHSQRCYRNLNCVIIPFDDPEIPLLWKSFYTQSEWINGLQSLKLSFFDTKSVKELLPSIASAIQMMPDLHALTLRKWIDEPLIYVHSPTILQSSTVKQLTIDSVCNIKIDMPQLQTFIGPFSAICHSANIAQPDALGNLKHFTLNIEKKDYCDWKNITQTELSIIRRLTHLETFEFMCFHDKIFIAICESCNMLKTLRLAIQVSTPSILDHLTKLNHLRQLEFKVFERAENPQFDFSPLTKLEKLTLQCCALNSLILPKSVKILNIEIGRDIHRIVIQTILKYKMQLTELTLNKINCVYNEQYEILKILPVLKNLEVLEFFDCYLGKSYFLDTLENRTLDRLRRLKFKNCYLETKQFLGLKEKFPNLKILVFDL